MKPLDGILVLDLSRILAGPLCTQRLADLGARVIKVEPAEGDATRGFGPPFERGESPYFMAFNRGKESVVLDLKRPEGIAFVERVLARADVLVDNFRPGVMERLGLDEARIREIAPEVVHLSVRGFALDGPRSREAAFDLAIQAESGVMAMTGEEGGEPCRVPFSASDLSAACYGAEAVLAALFRRERAGRGARIEVSLFDGTLAFTSFHAQTILLGGPPPERLGNRHPNLAPYQVFATSDGHLVLAVATDEQWRRFLALEAVPAGLDREEWRRNGGRTAEREALAAALAGVFAGADTDTWCRRLDEADVPYGRVRGLDDALAEVATRDDGFVTTRPHAVLGPTRVLGGPARIDGTRPTADRGAPALDEHGAALLAEFAADEAEARRWNEARGAGPR
ncbi:MAG: CoA transferase [Planctomycetota bacterium]